MMNKRDALLGMVEEMMSISYGLPPRERHKILNRCFKMRRLIKSEKTFEINPSDATTESSKLVKNPKAEIFNAMLNGRRVCQDNSKDFGVMQFHTYIVMIRQQIARLGLPIEMKSEWTLSQNGHRCKEYWLEEV